MRLGVHAVRQSIVLAKFCLRAAAPQCLGLFDTLFNRFHRTVSPGDYQNVVLIFAGNCYVGYSFVIDCHVKFNRATTYLAVFNIALLFNRAIEKNLDIFTAVGALYIAGHEFMHGL